MAHKQGKRPLGLYIHIPFCRSKCIYCDFYSLPNAEEHIKPYVKALATHLGEVGSRSGGYEVDTVYFGGGTPTLLPEKALRELLEAIRRSYDLAANAEITLEANPESAQDVQTLRRLRRAGFNRISLGVQAANDQLLKKIGRIHTWAQVESAVAAARKAGFDNLSLDLIYGLPGQSLDHWRATLEKALTLEVEHISCYGLKVEEGTPLYARAAEMDLPDDDAQADMYLACVELLSQRGFAQYEISNFAKPGRQSRHNMKYWKLEEYAGFGPGAHSDFGGVRYAYGRDLSAYVEGVLGGTLQVSEQEAIPLRSRDTEYIMLSLRTAAGISRPTFENTFRQRFAPLEEAFLVYEKAGLAVRTKDGWRLTAQGFLLSNTIISQLWEVHGAKKLRRAEAAARGDFRMIP